MSGQGIGASSRLVVNLSNPLGLNHDSSPLAGQSIILITVDGYGAALLNSTKADAEHGIHKIAAMVCR